MSEPAGDWTRDPSGATAEWARRTADALADGSAVEAIRDHLDRPQGGECVDWCPICRAADLVRANASPELRAQLRSLQRETLLTVRTLIDHYLERTPKPPPKPGPRVEDIPIE
jgi:hypothetical protein